MQIGEEGASPEIPLGDSVLAFRIQAMPGGFTRFSYRTATGDEDRQVIDVSEVLEKTVSTSKPSRPHIHFRILPCSPQTWDLSLPDLDLVRAQYTIIKSSTPTLDATSRHSVT